MKGQIRKAISDYEKLVSDDPRNIRIRTKLADLYVRNNDTDRAVDAYIQLARQYVDEDLNYRAISMYKKVLTIRPRMVEVHYWLADLYKKEGLFGNAKVLYQNIIKMSPSDEVARSRIDEIDESMAAANPLQKHDDLTAPFQSRWDGRLSRDDEPGRDEPLILDDILLDEPPVETASMGEEIVELEDPLDLSAESHETGGSDQPQDGENLQFTHQQVVLEDPVSPEKDLESHYHLGIAYMEMELIDQAIPEFEAAIAFGPKKIDCLVMLGQCYAEKGIPDRSIGYLEQALRLKGLTREDFVRINKELAKVYEACGMKEKAFQASQRAGLAEHRSERSNP